MLELEATFTQLFLPGTLDNAARIEELIGETRVGAQQVRLDAARWLHRHLRPVLQDVDRELGTWHARQPHAEILMHLEKEPDQSATVQVYE